MYTPPLTGPNISPNPKWKNVLIWGLIVAILAIIVSFANSCTTAKNAAKKATKIMDKYPAQVLPVLRQKAPCITVKLDTTYTTVDTIINVECTEQEVVKGAYFTDTIYKNETRTIRVPYKVTLPAKVITKYIEDSAKIKELSIRTTELSAERDQLTGKLKKVKKCRNWLILLFIAVIGWNFRNILLKFVLPYYPVAKV